MTDTSMSEDRRRATRFSPHWIATAFSLILACAAFAMSYGRDEQRSADLETRVAKAEKEQDALSTTVADQATDIATVRTELHIEYQEINRRFDQLDTEIQNAGSLTAKRQ